MPDHDTPMDTNMRIWDEVAEVPAEFCKTFHPNGDESVELTSVTPMYYFRQATEMWGPYGIGWGVEILTDEIICDKSEQPVLHTMKVQLWYDGPKPRRVLGPGSMVPDPLERYVPGVGCTPLQYTDDSGQQRWDDDFNKKTLTDAITNALSRLGFGAEIRLKNREGDKYLRRTSGSGGDDELLKAWGEFVAFMRAEHPDAVKTQTDEGVMAQATKKLLENQRRVIPEEVRRLMGK